MDFPDHEHLVDSTDFLDLVHLPKRIMFVAGGFISFEFAHLAARAGAATLIVDRGEGPLKSFDPDLVELLIGRDRDAGIDLRRSTTITGVEPAGCGYRVILEHDGVREIIEADLVVHRGGRIADLVALGLDDAGISWGERGVAVAGRLQSTSNPAICAAGDSADTAGCRSPRSRSRRRKSPRPT